MMTFSLGPSAGNTAKDAGSAKRDPFQGSPAIHFDPMLVPQPFATWTNNTSILLAITLSIS